MPTFLCEEGVPLEGYLPFGSVPVTTVPYLRIYGRPIGLVPPGHIEERGWL